jgi:hypothetical protein
MFLEWLYQKMHWLVGIFLRNASLPQGGAKRNCALSTANEQLPECFDFFRNPNTALKRPAEAFGAGQSRKFQDLRAKNMTKNERARAAIRHQDMRNLSCRAARSSPRGAAYRKSRRELARIRRISHGIARAFENLRRVRLSLVPGPDSRGSVLPQV